MKRVFGILYRGNKLPEIPAELKSKELELGIDYKSPLIRLQKSNEINALARFIQSMAPIIQINPASLDKLNYDALIDVIAEASGLNINALRSAEEVEAIRAQRAQQEAMQQAVAQSNILSQTDANLRE
jgi:hypothetical protein